MGHVADPARRHRLQLMFEALDPAAPDAILQVMADFRADPRQGKIDLGVGVFRTEDGRTPVMQAVKEAERLIWERQETKSYTALTGDPGYGEALAALVLNDQAGGPRWSHCASTGGTGALRHGLELARTANPGARVFISDPSWPNHAAIAAGLGMEIVRYPYLSGQEVDIEAMTATLATAKAGDVVILHGCCHNPTGADPDEAGWQAVTECLARTGAVPLADLAYLGFGDGLEADGAAVRHLAANLPEMMLAVSCSKNFGLYRDRAGLLAVQSRDAATAQVVQGRLATLNRLAFSFPPDHGAEVVRTILTTPALRSSWQSELTAMRLRIEDMRQGLAQALAAETGSTHFAFLTRQKGMFSLLGLNPGQTAALARDHGVYMPPDGRINIAGLSAASTPAAARAIAAVTGTS